MGEAKQGELDLLLNVCDRILGKCLCPLGDSLAMPVVSYVTHFREEFQRHIDEGCCPFTGREPHHLALPPAEGGGRPGMTTFSEAVQVARRRIESGDDPDQVVPALLALAEAPEEIDMAAALYGDDPADEEDNGDG